MFLIPLGLFSGAAKTVSWADVFGNKVRQGLGPFKVSAWGGDPWIRGAYSAQVPGALGMRGELARSIDDCLLFAGEATSPELFSTAHGAYLSGHRAVQEIVDAKSQ